MIDSRRADLRNIMLMAWGFYRTAKQSAERRPFSDCLKGAWKMAKALRDTARAIRGPTFLRFSKDLIRSPIARAHGNGSLQDFHGAYTTALLGR